MKSSLCAIEVRLEWLYRKLEVSKWWICIQIKKFSCEFEVYLNVSGKDLIQTEVLKIEVREGLIGGI